MFKKSDIKDIYSLSPMQSGMLFHYIMDSASSAYFEQARLTLKGHVDISLFEKSFNYVIEKHEPLRTIFLYEKVNEPLQAVLKKRTGAIFYNDLSNNNEEEKQSYVKDFAVKDRQQGFDLAEGIPMRIAVIKTGAEEYEVIWSFHHIIMDGWCLGIIMEDFFKAYSLFGKGKEISAVNNYPYSDYIKWLQEQNKEEAMAYWKNYLQDYEQQAAVPKQYRITNENTYLHCETQFELNEAITEGLKRLARENQISLNIIFQTIWGILLQRYNNTKDVVFGAVVSGRPPQIAGIERMVGLFINTIPVRIKEDNESFMELSKKIQENALKSMAYDYMLITDIQSNTVLKNNLFDHIMVFENYPMNKQVSSMDNSQELGFSTQNFEMLERTNYDFNIIIIPGERINLNFQHNENIYSRKQIEQISKHFKMVIDQILEKPEINPASINIVDNEEAAKLLKEFNNTKAEYPREKTIQQLFEEQAAKTPNNIAVVYKEEKLTYKELNEKSNQLAGMLRAKGVKPDTIVGIMVERSLEMIIGIMGILKAGAAYLPIDSEYPEDRIKYILSDSGTSILLQKGSSNNYDIEAAALDEDFSNYSTENTEAISDPNNLAYIIYTSGSTGKPKGTMIKQGGLVNYITWANKVYVKNESLDFPLYSSFSFDLTVTSIFTPLISGNKIVVYKDQEDEPIIRQVFLENKVGIVKLTPAHLSMIKDIDNSNSSIKRLILGGEDLKSELAKEVYESFNKNVEIYNEYGPTETVVGCMLYKYDYNKDKNISVSIGKPADNVQIYILDSEKQVLPIGIAGEIYIGGDGVSKGYINREELTAERFIPNPFVLGERMYRSGDLARWLPDGNIEFLGRIDNQVKIRGFRIELGEIEARLQGYEGIEEAIVIAREDKDGSSYLCAYVSGTREFTIDELRAYIGGELPEYMIPSYIVQLEKLPITTNGKVDKKALPEPKENIVTGIEYVAATNETEEILIAIWKEVLGIENIGINDSFFSLGGDSIKAIQVTSRLHKYNMKLDIKQLIQNQTIGKISKYVEYSSIKSSQEPVTGEVLQTPIQKWFFEHSFTDMHHWNQAVMLQAVKGFDGSIINKVFTKILEHHDALRTVFEIYGQEVKQVIKPINEHMYDFEVYDFRSISDYLENINSKSSEVQASIDLEKGPLVKVVMFKTTEGDYLLIAIHHLIVDGISWRIILEDFAIGYNQCMNNQNIEFQLKSDSYKLWAKALQKYSSSDEIRKEIEYWTAVENSNITQLSDTISDYIVSKEALRATNKLKDSDVLTIEFTVEQTEKLLMEVNNAYSTEINDILLSALGYSLREWTGNSSILIGLEGHGREENVGNININRTIGWFTSIFPVILDMTKHDSLAYQIKSIKESLRQIPNKGIGYGILKYLTPIESRQELSFSQTPEISFNYLGQFEENNATDIFNVLGIAAGDSMSLESERINLIDINGIIAQGKLTLSFNYSKKQLTKDGVLKLADYYKIHLLNIIEHCVSTGITELTPSDITLDDISLEQLDEIYDFYKDL
ncbi:MAG: amino acid adenylation domain-containing protein [Lutisporaceae bacterium]